MVFLKKDKDEYSPGVVAVIVAAGKGERLKGESGIAKQYLKIGEQSVLEICLQKFLGKPEIDSVLVVINKDHEDTFLPIYQNLKKSFGSKLVYTYGGPRRQDSVKNALDALKVFNPEKVLIHDASRIFVTDEQILETISLLNNYSAVTLAQKATDTMYEIDDERVSSINRENTYCFLTPQAFEFSAISAAHEKFKDHEFTDDMGLYFMTGENNFTILNAEGDNFKITQHSDFIKAKDRFEKGKEKV